MSSLTIVECKSLVLVGCAFLLLSERWRSVCCFEEFSIFFLGELARVILYNVVQWCESVVLGYTRDKELSRRRLRLKSWWCIGSSYATPCCLMEAFPLFISLLSFS